MTKTILLAAAAMTLMGGAAIAQTATTDMAPPTAQSTQPMTPTDPVTGRPMDSSMQSTMPNSSSTMTPMAPTGMATDVVSTSSPEQQAMMKAGDPNVVTNGPVADTPENRAKYGAPMSRAGKRTAARGN